MRILSFFEANFKKENKMKLIAGWTTPLGLLKAEVDQKEYEGFIVPEPLKVEINALEDEVDAENDEVINE